MMFRPRINIELIITIVGAIVLSGIVVSAWVPQPCSYLRHAISGCSVHYIAPPLTPAQQELARVPHDTIQTDIALFTAKPEDKRTRTTVDFQYHDPIQRTAYLELKEDDDWVPLATVDSPALSELNWPVIKDSGYSIYQRSGNFSSLSSFLQSLPSANQLAVDASSAKLLNLSPSQYTPLETLTSFDSLNYILTTYNTPEQDGQWYKFSHTFNLQDTQPTTSKGEFEWRLDMPNSQNLKTPFLLGTVHIGFLQ